MAEVQELTPLMPDRPAATRSLCPECLRVIPAERTEVSDGSGPTGEVRLIKRCPEHGEFSTVIWRGAPPWRTWRRPKSPSLPHAPGTATSRGCPHDCGLCPEHGQHTCTGLLEVTARCDLGCPICFAASEVRPGDDPALDVIAGWYAALFAASGPCNVQLSGGEPTVRDDLPQIVAMGKEAGFPFIQVNSNGLRLARDEAYGESLAAAGLDSVFLQFDGLDDGVLTRLRGRPLAELKRRAVARCGELGLGVVLVCTVVPGVNDHLLGEIVRFGVEAGSAVRGVHFQPVSYFGRYPAHSADQAVPATPTDAERITLPELMRGLESQTESMLQVADFVPPGCEHELCSFSAVYARTPDGRLERQAQSGCCTPASADTLPTAAEGARRTKAGVARRWTAPPPASDPSTLGDGDLDRFLAQAARRVFSVSAMAFQDAWTVDLERLRGCCIHVVAPDGRLVPFCAWNITAADGTPLHRSRV